MVLFKFFIAQVTRAPYQDANKGAFFIFNIKSAFPPPPTISTDSTEYFVIGQGVK